MAKQLRAVLQILGKVVDVGGESANGWIPSNAATPPPTPTLQRVVDIRVLDEGEGGFILQWESSTPGFSNDTWHATIEEALRSAEERFGVDRSEWREPSA